MSSLNYTTPPGLVCSDLWNHNPWPVQRKSLNVNKFQSNTQSDFAHRLFLVIYSLLFVIGIIANSIVIYVYAKEKNPIKHTKYSFINLVILILLLCTPYPYFFNFKFWSVGKSFMTAFKMGMDNFFKFFLLNLLYKIVK